MYCVVCLSCRALFLPPALPLRTGSSRGVVAFDQAVAKIHFHRLDLAPHASVPAIVRPSRWAALRELLLTHVVLGKWFDNMVLVIILGNCIALALDNPLDDPDSYKQQVLVKLDSVRSSASAAHIVPFFSL